MTWWFRARSDWAREIYLRRRIGSVEAFDRQMKTLKERQSELQAFYGSAIVETLAGPNEHVRPETLYDTLFRIEQ